MPATTLPSGGFLGLTLRTRDVRGARLVESRYSTGASLTEHCHAKAHFCYVLSGDYDEILLGRTVGRGPGTLIFLPAALAHAEIHHSDGRHFLVELDDAPLGAHDLVQGIGSPIELPDPETTSLMARLHAEFASMETVLPLVPDAPARLTIECLIVELAAEARRGGRPRPRARPAPWLERSREQIHERFDESIGLAELARGAGVHPAHLAERFRARYGRSIGEYQRRVRVRFACERIQHTRDPLVEIAHAAGFCDQSHMCHAFRRELGVTPGAFRRASR